MQNTKANNGHSDIQVPRVLSCFEVHHEAQVVSHKESFNGLFVLAWAC